MLEISRTSLVRLAGLACRHALYQSREGRRQAAIVSTGPLAKMNISHSDIANTLPKVLQPFQIVSVADILKERIPDVLKGGMVVTGYSDKFLSEDLGLRNLQITGLKYNYQSVENKIQDYIRSISTNHQGDFDAGHLWFLILSETMPHGNVFDAHCWWFNGPFSADSAVSEMRFSVQNPDKIDLVNFRNNISNEWIEKKTNSFSTSMLD